MQKLSKLYFFFLFLTLSFKFSINNVSAQTLNCKFSSLASDTCQIQFGLTCSPGTHPERDCPLDCSFEGEIKCVSDSIPTPIPTTEPTDCSQTNGSCQPNDPSLCTGPLTVSPQCAPQKDSTGSSFRCCKPPIPTVDIETPTETPTFESSSDAFPKLKLRCDKIKPIEFHSLRPYQAAACGEAPKAQMCSNTLRFIESFDMDGTGDCKAKHIDDEGTWRETCTPGGGDFPSGGHIVPHNLFVELDDSFFPIMGNTEEVLNSQNGGDTYNDATKVNEYVSWYLSGVNGRAEYGDVTNDQIINYSGPVKKLIPSIIQDSERIKTIENVTNKIKFIPEDETEEIEDPQNHDQIVVCAEKQISLVPEWFTDWFDTGAIGLGKITPVPCNEGGSKYRLTKWIEDPSLINIDVIKPYLAKLVPNDIAQYLIEQVFVDRWPKNIPPLPWSDKEGKPFETNEKYQKAYNEWKGDLCAFIPLPVLDKDFLLCIGIPGVTNNEFADLYPFIPLSNTTDKQGSENIVGDGPSYTPDAGTTIENAQHESMRSPPLYFAHTQEVNDLSLLLNKTYTPNECVTKDGETDCKLLKNKPLPKTTETYNNCKAVNVRTNKGDNLFPGDPDELQVIGVEYWITQATCFEHNVWDWCKGTKGYPDYECMVNSFSCNAQVTINIRTETKTPYATEIYQNTVANSGSTFRKIFPKLEKGAPVECIADIPTVTTVTYDASKSQKPKGGSQTFKVIPKPEDAGGSGEDPQLTFPHIGSIYEYFLNGIQTALRPKGYGEPIVSGIECNRTSTGSGACKQWLFEKDKKGNFYYDNILEAASNTSCNGGTLNPYWAIAIALNENGGLMTDDLEGLSKSHFGCAMTQLQSVEAKTACMVNTLQGYCLQGKSDEETLGIYGYPDGYIMWPITVLDYGGTYPPPLFGNGFDIEKLKANLLNTDWRASYSSVAPIFCPNSSVLPY